MSMAEQEEAEKVEISDVREGERIRIEYRSAQSRSRVSHTGTVVDADRYGQQTKSFVLLGDNDIEYRLQNHRNVKSTGENRRKLSTNRPDVYRVEELEIENWERTETVGALRIRFVKNEVFDCPVCRASNKASVNSVNEDNVTVSCGDCRNVEVLDDQPLDISLKIQR